MRLFNDNEFIKKKSELSSATKVSVFYVHTTDCAVNNVKVAEIGVPSQISLLRR